MGKNKKKHCDVWDISTDNQKEMMDRFYDAQNNGEVDLFDLGGMKKTKKKHRIEEEILQHIESTQIPNQDTSYPTFEQFTSNVDFWMPPEPELLYGKPQYDVLSQYENEQAIVEENNEEELAEAIEEEPIRDYGIQFHYWEGVGILQVDGLYTNFSIREDSMDLVGGVSDREYDADDIISITTKLYFNIITSLYPTMIYTSKEFDEKFTNYSSIDNNHFMIFKNLDYYFVYVVHREEKQNLFNFIEDVVENKKSRSTNIDENIETIKLMLSITYCVDTVYSGFPYCDVEYIERYRKHIINKTDQKYWTEEEVQKDELTVFNSNSVRDEYENIGKRMNVIDLHKFKSHIHQLITELSDDFVSSDDRNDITQDSTSYDVADSTPESSETTVSTPIVDPVEERKSTFEDRLAKVREKEKPEENATTKLGDLIFDVMRK